MALTLLTLLVANPAKPKKLMPVEFLVDSGAGYSVVPAAVLRKLNVNAPSPSDGAGRPPPACVPHAIGSG